VMTRAGHGSIVIIASIAGLESTRAPLPYGAAKAALAHYSKGLARQLGASNIRVNAVAPGPIWTPLIPSTFEPEKVEKFGQDVPLGRPGQPDEVAPCYVFLASSDASYITGQTLHPNGGTIVNG